MARGLVKRFGSGRAERRVLDGADLDVAPGELVAVLGRSGSGKSTLLHLIGGMDRADAGSIEVAGVRVDREDERGLTRFRRDQIGFVFQFFHLIPELTGEENVLMPARLTRRRLARRARHELLERMALNGAAQRLPHTLSGGEQQRIAIARALVNDAPLLLADEPTGNLDAESGHSVLALLRELAGGERAVVLVTHDAEAATHRRPRPGARRRPAAAGVSRSWPPLRTRRGRALAGGCGRVRGHPDARHRGHGELLAGHRLRSRRRARRPARHHRALRPESPRADRPRLRGLPNVAARSYRSEVRTSSRPGTGPRRRRTAVEVVGGGAARLRDRRWPRRARRPGEVVWSAASRAMGAPAGDRLTVGRSATRRWSGSRWRPTTSPTRWPARRASWTRAPGSAFPPGAVPVNIALIWVHDPPARRRSCRRAS